MSRKLAEIAPYHAEAGIEIYLADSTEFAAEIAGMEGLVIADPPYGVSERTQRRKNGRSVLARCNDFPAVIGDDGPFDPTPWLACARLALWGANHYADRLPSSPSWIVWDKRDGQGSNDNADCELAWTNLGGPARLFHHTWKGMIRASERGPLMHPTQKPVALMAWLIEQHTKPGDLVIDPYMGSGPVLVAAKQLGRRAIGFDLEPRYLEITRGRLTQEISFAKYPDEKDCPGCKRRLRVDVGVTFNRKASSPDGLQPWCRECDASNKIRKENGFKNFLRTLKARGKGEDSRWSEEQYARMMGPFVCKYCGSDVTKWGGGYWVDRISNLRGYEPENCAPCCWPCNQRKRNRNPEVFFAEISALLERYPRGSIPWDEIDRHRAVDGDVPRLSAFAIEERQLSLLNGS